MNYFFTIAGRVEHGIPVYIIGPLASEVEIIEMAQEELEPGETLAQRAGGEFDAALQKLNEGEKVFEIFDCSHDGEIRRFMGAAEALGLDEEARDLIAAATGII